MRDPQPVKAILRELKARGATVILPDGEHAWLPANEVYADFRSHEDFRDRGKGLEGQILEVVELDSQHWSSERFVSHVRVRNDPWAEVSKWRDGEVKVMDITARTRTRAMGIIHPGIRAEVKIESLNGMLPPSWEDFQKPLVGDEVAGLFRQRLVGNEERVVTLDFVSYLRSSPNLVDVLLPESTAELRCSSISEHEPEESPADRPEGEDLAGIDLVLVVEDNETIRRGVVGFLIGNGCRTVECASEDDAMEAIDTTNEDFDLAIIDVQLGEAGDMGGLAVAGYLQEKQTDCRIIIMTGLDLDADYFSRQEKHDVLVSGYITKPFNRDDLHRALATANGQSRTLSSVLPGSNREPRSHSDHGSDEEDAELGEVAERFRKTIQADAVVVFSIHPISYAVEQVAIADPDGHCHVTDPRFACSPVRDVAIDGEVVLTGDATRGRDRGKHRFLQEAYHYSSCAAVPINTGTGTSRAHALFAFAWQPEAFGDLEVDSAHQAAQQMGYLLRIQQLLAEIRENMPFQLMGKVYGSMAHDLSEALTMDAGTDRAKSIVTTFRNMARGVRDDVTTFSLDDELAAIVSRFQVEARRYGARLEFRREAQASMLVQMRKSGFEQIIYNLLLNAVQQIGRLRKVSGRKGQVTVVLRSGREDGNARDGEGHWATILVYDNGPGIHRQDFTKVFGVRYTTKPRGCGMGLDICRRTAHDTDLGGRRGALRVRRSILLAGTVFELTLPITEEG